MTIPIWMLLGFATWTIVLLLFTVGIYRWSRILTGREAISNFQADKIVGDDWYRRAMRAHANCIENLPVFGVIVFALYVSDIDTTAVNLISVCVLIARIIQSLIHVCFIQTNIATALRFTFFFIQIICFVLLITTILSFSTT